MPEKSQKITAAQRPSKMIAAKARVVLSTTSAVELIQRAVRGVCCRYDQTEMISFEDLTTTNDSDDATRNRRRAGDNSFFPAMQSWQEMFCKAWSDLEARFRSSDEDFCYTRRMRTRSPFPGMDPWLESYWGDMHHRIIQYGCDQLESQLPAGLVAVVETTMYLIDSDWETHRIKRPDFAVVEYGREFTLNPSQADEGGLAVAEPLKITLPTEPITQGHIEIRNAGSGGSLITAIEVLSPANKKNPFARSAYLQKRKDYFAAKINVVELDLLRAGEHLIGVPLEAMDAAFNTPYKCAVRRGGELSGLEVEYYPMPLRLRLPRIRLPLRASDRDIIFDLQDPIDQAYRKGRYALQIDYSVPPEPPLNVDDAQWAGDLIRSSGTD